MKDCNVHDSAYRETKQPQGGAARSISSLFRLDNRTIIITGGAGFLGVEVAVAVLESGGDVVCLDILHRPRGDDWARVCETAASNSCGARYYQCDTTDETKLQETFAAVAQAFRHPIRGLVACAAISLNAPSVDFNLADFRRLLDINVTGTFSVARAVAREMQKANVSGSIVLVASMSGHVSNKGVDTTAYNSSKAAVHQMARSLAAEWGSRVGMPLIRVNTLSPGYIRTAATAEALQKPGMEDQWTGDNMLYRLSTVDEYRAPVLFLLGDGSSFMTGADLRVDGGHCAW